MSLHDFLSSWHNSLTSFYLSAPPMSPAVLPLGYSAPASLTFLLLFLFLEHSILVVLLTWIIFAHLASHVTSFRFLHYNIIESYTVDCFVHWCIPSTLGSAWYIVHTQYLLDEFILDVIFLLLGLVLFSQLLIFPKCVSVINSVISFVFCFAMFSWGDLPIVLRGINNCTKYSLEGSLV